jgi:hypothetical protein
MQYKELKNKAKKLGIRVTKTVGGKRVKLSAKELRSKIAMNFENSVKNAQRVIRICRTVVIQTPGPPPSLPTRGPPPPPPPPPPGANARARLLVELKNALRRRRVS